MQKEIFIVIFIILAIISAHVVTQNYTQKSVSLMSDKLNEIEEIAKQIDENDKENEYLKEELTQKISATRIEWQKINKKMAFYIEHNELEKVNTSLILMEGYLNMEDYSQGVPELQNCEYILYHIKDKQALQIINLF